MLRKLAGYSILTTLAAGIVTGCAFITSWSLSIAVWSTATAFLVLAWFACQLIDGRYSRPGTIASETGNSNPNVTARTHGGK